jgi:hypothetical protein
LNAQIFHSSLVFLCKLCTKKTRKKSENVKEKLAKVEQKINFMQFESSEKKNWENFTQFFKEENSKQNSLATASDTC